MKFIINIVLVFVFILKINAQSYSYLKINFGYQIAQSNVSDDFGINNYVIYSNPTIHYGLNYGYQKNKLSMEIGVSYNDQVLGFKTTNTINFLFSKYISIHKKVATLPLRINYLFSKNRLFSHQVFIEPSYNIFLTDGIYLYNTVLEGVEDYRDKYNTQKVPYRIDNKATLIDYKRQFFTFSVGYSFNYTFNRVKFILSPYFTFGLNSIESRINQYKFETIDVSNNFKVVNVSNSFSFSKGDLIGLNFGIIYNLKK